VFRRDIQHQTVDTQKLKSLRWIEYLMSFKSGSAHRRNAVFAFCLRPAAGRLTPFSGAASQ